MSKRYPMRLGQTVEVKNDSGEVIFTGKIEALNAIGDSVDIRSSAPPEPTSI